MAGLAEPVGSEMRLSMAPWSAASRAQYAALAAMRWGMFKNSLRSMRGAMELGARVFLWVLYGCLGLGLACGLGAGAYAAASSGKWGIVSVLFWVIFMVWQIVPITFAAFQEQFDLNILLRFPVSFASYYVLHLVFGLIDASTIFGALCCTGVWVGITLAAPAQSIWSAWVIALYGLFNVLLVRAVFAWIDRWLAQRRTREILTAVFLVLVLAAQFANPALRKHGQMGPLTAQQRQEAMTWLHRGNAVQSWLPPGLVGRALSAQPNSHPAEFVESSGLLALYLLASAAALGVRLRAQYRGENFGEAPARETAPRTRQKWLLDGSGPIAAVVEKDLRSLLRALPLLYALGSPLLMVFVFSGLYRNQTGSVGHMPIGFLLSLAYVTLGFTQILYNNLGAEGAGIQLLFLSPTPIRTVLLAKNVFHASLFALDALLVFIIAAFRYGLPQYSITAAIIAWTVFALPVHLAMGNLFSITMPYRMNLGRIGRQRGSQTSALLSMLVQATVLAIGAAVFFLCGWTHRLWLATPIFLALALMALLGWFRVLSNVDVMANRRRDILISTLARTE